MRTSFARRCGVIFGLLCLLPGVSKAAVGNYAKGPLITEFMASNTSGLRDENGSYEDWIEIHNPTPAAINLDGWCLTDNAANLTKWRFPAVSLPSHGFLVVFASEKNRRNPAATLHTNFKLSASGEYLALVKPDGVTIAWDHAPTFPEQLPNVSYGVTPLPGTPTTLIGAGAPAEVLVPTEAPSADWIQPTFVPGSGWTAAHTGIGYDDNEVDGGGARILFVVNTSANSAGLAGDQSVVDRLTLQMGHEVTVIDDSAVQAANATGMEMVLISSTVDSSAVNTKLRDVPLPIIFWERGLTDDFLMCSSGGSVTLQTAINLTTVGAANSLGAGLPPGPIEVRQTAGTLNTATISNLSSGAVVVATASNGEPAITLVPKGGALRSNATAPGDRMQIFLNDDGAAALTPDGLAFFDACIDRALTGFIPPAPYGRMIQGNIGAEMKGVNPSALIRLSFTPDSVQQYESLSLKMKCDDGYVVWLNGVEVARRNAPQALAWNSAATAESSGLDTEVIDLTAWVGLLVANSPNTLAIQGLNVAAEDIDFVVMPTLIASTEIVPFVQYYTIATPGAVNNTTNLGLVPEVEFSVQRGYFEEPFSLTLTNTLAGAQIRYTTDGSVPTATTGTAYTGPIPISTTATLRACAFRTGYSTRRPDTQTYLRIADIIHQPAALPGWPQPLISVGNDYRIHDYEMDPEIVDDPAYTADLIKGMTEIPTVSIVVKKGDMWNVNTGIGGFYRGTDVEKSASVEFINPAAPSENVQGDCSIQGHSHDRMKRSLRLSFKSAFGETKFNSSLFTGGPLANGTGNPEVDNIVLRAGNNHSFARSWNPARSTYTEDEWYRGTQIAMGGPGSPGRFVHLFINGIYWGLYNPLQRPDADFAAQMFGGDKDDWFSINHGGTHGGDTTRWDYLNGALAAKDMSVPANYDELRSYIAPGDFIDYLLCAWYSGMNDWPVNNWWGGNNNVPGGPFRFFCWDGETSWGTGNQANLNAWVHPSFRRTGGDLNSPAARIWHAARQNPDFMALFADRVNKHLSSGGALSTGEAVARWDKVNDHIRNAVIADSARWGDVMQEPPTRRDVEWQAEVTRVRNLMQTGTPDGSGVVDNATLLKNAVRSQGYYPSIDPPVFAENGGEVPEGFSLEITNPNTEGTVYFTLDGSDPRLSGGAVNPSAAAYSTAVPIGYTLAVKARVLNGTTWSAIQESTFVSETLPPLRVTEIMYHPAPATPFEISEGFADEESFEFLEIQNVGPHGIDLGGAKFTSGITFTFGPRILAPGGILLLVENLNAFRTRYGDAPQVDGVYTGNLDSSGERIRLKSAAGETLIDFIYDDEWHPVTDHGGNSLVALDIHGPLALWGTAGGWRPSTNVNGSPGIEDPAGQGGGVVGLTFAEWRALQFAAADLEDLAISGPNGDPDGDGLINLLEFSFGTDPEFPQQDHAAADLDLVTSRGVPAMIPNPSPEGAKFLAVYACRVGAASVGLVVSPMFGSDLEHWNEASVRPSVLADDGEIQILAVPFPEGGPQFFHLEVSLAH